MAYASEVNFFVVGGSFPCYTGKVKNDLPTGGSLTTQCGDIVSALTHGTAACQWFAAPSVCKIATCDAEEVRERSLATKAQALNEQQAQRHTQSDSVQKQRLEAQRVRESDPDLDEKDEM